MRPVRGEQPRPARDLAEIMNRFRRQFFSGLFALIAATAGALWLNGKYNALPNYAFLTGWALLAGMFVLTIYNVRKKLPFLPLGKSETWLQIHIYLGFFTRSEEHTSELQSPCNLVCR